MKISHLKNSQIDRRKWDECISNSFNGIVYAYSWYLDIVNEDWEALVNENYTQVMPLTCGKKYKISYLYQPYFTQQLGVFSTEILDNKTVEMFLEAIPETFKFYEICLNTFNKVENYPFKIDKKVTFELDLIPSYEKLHVKYSTNTKRNIKKAINSKVYIISGLQPNEIINLFKSTVGEKLGKLKEAEYDKIRKIIAIAHKFNIGTTLGAYSEKNELCAAAFIITTHNKSIFLFAASNDMGKENGAMFLIIDYFIKKHSEKNITLDFEGSVIDGLARFYAGFGAKACEYYSLKKNVLPWYIKLIKS